MHRFVADSMVGKLARWLRALGYDTLYFRRKEDSELVDLARTEDRILLTRDRPLASKYKTNVFLVESEHPSKQLYQVFAQLGLSLDETRLLARCLVCNAETSKVPKEEVQDRVPPFVYRNHYKFTLCPGCHRVYWRASHVKGILQALREGLRK